MCPSNTLSKKEVRVQKALGTMTRGDEFVEHIKQTVKPVSWPTDKELHKAYPDLTKWMKLVDKTLGKVIKQFNIFFTDEEVNASPDDIFISFEVNTRFGSDWSAVMCGGDDDKREAIFEHLQIISPLMIAGITNGPYNNIEETTDS